MTKPIFLKIARAISCLLTILVMLVMEDQTFLLRRPSSATFLMVSFLTYTDYKFWKSFLIAGTFSFVTGFLFLGLWPNGLTLTAGQLLGLGAVLASLAGLAHALIKRQA